MSSYDPYRGRRGGGNSRDRSDRDRSESSSRGGKRDRDDDRAGPSFRNSKFQKRGGRGGGRGRGGGGRGRGGGRKPREEFCDSPITRVEGLDKRGEFIKAKEKRVQLCANYFRVKSQDIHERVTLTMYHVKFDPETTNRKFRASLIRQLNLGTNNFDGSACIYLVNKLPDKVTKFNTKANDGEKFRITLTETKEIKTTDAMFFTVLNLIVRNALEALNLQLVGRNYYDAVAKIDIPDLRIQIWPGYITSIRQHEASLLLCCEMAHKVMREDNILKIIAECYRECNSRGMDYRREASKRIIGSTVLTDYTNKMYKINEIDWESSPLSTFTMNGVEKSYMDYYKEKYKIEINDSRQPLLMSKPNAKAIRGGAPDIILLVPELCRATGLEDSMRSDFKKMREMSDRIRMTPNDRVQKLLKFNDRLQTNEKSKQKFKDNKLMLDTELVEFEGRRLEQQTIIFGNNESVKPEEMSSEIRDTCDWTQLLKSKKLYVPTRLDRWIYIYPNEMEKEAKDFMTRFLVIARKMGMVINNSPESCVIQDIRSDTYVSALKKALSQDYGFIMIGVVNTRADVYSAIKLTTLCGEETNPTPVQVIVKRTMTMKTKTADSVATKVAIQVNAKLGGTPWYVKIPTASIMIIGFDVSHDTRDKRKSFGAMVAHYYHKGIDDANFEKGGQYFSAVNDHTDGQNISKCFHLNAISAVRAFIDKYQQPPARIIIYRDGVGDGNIEYVMQNEVNVINNALKPFYQNFNMEVQLGFIVINKKINTRIFQPVEREDKRRYEEVIFINPLPGTVVDDVITLPERYDFYLISQSVNTGTVAPTSYNIIYDTLKFGPTQIQQLTYKLCHLYFNWSGSTRIPSVVQYAKKLAFLSAQFLHQAPNSSQMSPDSQLFFL